MKEQNFDKNSFAVIFDNDDQATVVDKFGAKIILKYTKESGVEKVSTLASMKVKGTQIQMKYIDTKKHEYER